MIFPLIPRLCNLLNPSRRSRKLKAAYAVSPNGVRDKLEKACRGCRRKRQGAAVVEFAIVAPIFFLLIFGMIEFGRAIMVQQVLTNAAREGARVAVLDGSTASGVNTTINTYLQSAGISGAAIDITPDEPASAGYGQPVTIAIQVPFSSVSWLPAPWFLGSANLSASCIMRRETVE